MVKVPKIENLPKQPSNAKTSSRYEAYTESLSPKLRTPEKECSPFVEAPKSDRQKSVRMHLI